MTIHLIFYVINLDVCQQKTIVCRFKTALRAFRFFLTFLLEVLMAEMLVALFPAFKVKSTPVKFALDDDCCVKMVYVRTQQVFVSAHFSAINAFHLASYNLVYFFYVLVLFSLCVKVFSASCVEVTLNSYFLVTHFDVS